MISATGTIVATYYHQYYVTANLDPVAGGSVSVESGWFNSGTPFQSVASANSGWQFESWKGSGSGSYSGFGGNASAIVNAPLIETATFYPGLTITPSSKGSVSYSGGAITGSIQTATPGTVFAPQGTTIQLIAKSKLFIYSFAGWTGSSVSSKNTVSIVLNSPLSISANFSYNYVIIWIVSAMVIAAIIILTLLMLRRRRSKRHITRSMSQDEL
jgi:hypothetical protein